MEDGGTGMTRDEEEGGEGDDDVAAHGCVAVATAAGWTLPEGQQDTGSAALYGGVIHAEASA